MNKEAILKDIAEAVEKAVRNIYFNPYVPNGEDGVLPGVPGEKADSLEDFLGRTWISEWDDALFSTVGEVAASAILDKLLSMAEVRDANCVTALELLPLIPNEIKGSTEKTSPDNLRWMMNRVVQEVDTFPLDKTGRWIGFVQGVLALSGNLDVDAERDKTRQRYQAAYSATGQTIPETKNRE